MKWTNSILIFYNNITYILQEKIPQYTILYIDNVSIKGLLTRYKRLNNIVKVLTRNSEIRKFVFEHIENINKIL